MDAIIKLPIALLLTVAVACGSEPDTTSPSTTNTAPGQIRFTQSQLTQQGMQLVSLEKRVISKEIEVSGVIDVPPPNRAKVSAYYSGFVQSVRVLPGEQVRKGQLLFTLKNPEYLQMQQDYLEAQLQLGYLQADYERLKILAAESISSEKNFRKAESDYQVMHARSHALAEQLKLMNLAPDDLTPESIISTYPIYAPISGFVTEVNVSTNEYLDASDVAIGIVNTDHIHLELQVFEQHALQLEEGQRITFSIPESGTQAFDGEVFLVGKSVDPERRTIDVHGHIEEEDRAHFIPGMFVKATIKVAGDSLWCLPTHAIDQGGDMQEVLRLMSDQDDTLTFQSMRITAVATSERWTAVEWSEELAKAQFLVRGD